jgi:hypothetical protein
MPLSGGVEMTGGVPPVAQLIEARFFMPWFMQTRNVLLIRFLRFSPIDVANERYYFPVNLLIRNSEN